MPNGAPGATQTQNQNQNQNQARVIQQGAVRVLCIADVRGTSGGSTLAAMHH